MAPTSFPRAKSARLRLTTRFFPTAVTPYPRFGWSLSPQFRQSLFDPSQPFRFALLAGRGRNVDLGMGSVSMAHSRFDIYDTFGKLRASQQPASPCAQRLQALFREGKNHRTSSRIIQWTVKPGGYAMVRAVISKDVCRRRRRGAVAAGAARWLGVTLYQVCSASSIACSACGTTNVLIDMRASIMNRAITGLNFNVMSGAISRGTMA